jgi:hypothetical protein
MKSFRQILLAEETVKSAKLIKAGNTKSIDLFQQGDKFLIIMDTESPAPTTVRGVKSTLVRTKAEDEGKAMKMFDKKVAFAKKKGWKEK